MLIEVTPWAIAADYPTLRDAINERRKALRISMTILNEMAGLPDGYSHKLFCGTRSFGPESLARVLTALKCCLIVADSSVLGQASTVQPLIHRYKTITGCARAKGGQTRISKLTAQQRRDLARKGYEAGIGQFSRQRKYAVLIKATEASRIRAIKRKEGPKEATHEPNTNGPRQPRRRPAVRAPRAKEDAPGGSTPSTLQSR